MFPTPEPRRAAPPFWELEKLVRDGFGHDAAIAILAARREQWDGRRAGSPASRPALLARVS